MLPLTALGVVFSLVFLVLFLRIKKGEPGKPRCFIAFLAWSGYVAYEGIYISDWLTTVTGAPIRVDLLFIGLILAVLSKRAFKSVHDPIC